MKSLFVFAATLALAFSAGCGYIADKDRIVIAKLDGKSITRGDLEKVIREMPDDERPLIQSKGDLLRTLNKYIDDQIKQALSEELFAEGKISVPREAAREAYLQKHPEYRAAMQIQDPTQLDMTQGQVEAVKAEVEFGTDEEMQRLLGEQAVTYKMQQALQNRELSITPEEIQREYDVLKRQLIKPEYVEFKAIRFPQDMPNAIEKAAQARRRIQSGERFDDVLASYMKQDPSLGMQTGLENDPRQPRFEAFWRTVHGAEVGQVYGPVLLPAHQQVGHDAQGKQVVRQYPAAFVVIQVVAHEAERQQTLEEATNAVAASILRRKVMERLREAHGVEVYPDKLPNPAGFGDQYKDLTIDTGQPAGDDYAPFNGGM